MAHREEQFVAAYLVEPHGKKAAMAAGYSERRAAETACNLLARPRVQALLREKQAAQLAVVDLTAARVKAEIAAIALLDPAECLDARGLPLPLTRMPARVRAAIKSLTVTVIGTKATSCRIEFCSKVDALHLAAKHLALLAPREVNVHVRFPHAHLTDEELKQRLLDSANTLEHAS